MRELMRFLVAGAAAAGLMLASAGAATAAAPAAAAALPAAAAGANDIIVFRSGRKVEGTILEENDSVVKIQVVSAGGISAPMTYNKSEILVIERGAGAAKAEEKPAEKAAASAAKQDPARPKPAGTGSGARVYFATLKGEFGRDISQTPIREMVRDARRHQVDYLILQLDNDFKIWGTELREIDHMFDQLWRAEEIAPVLTTEIRDDPEWEKKPQLVFWVKRAMGGAAFLPFISRTIYFHPEGRMGGIGRLEEAFRGGGDKVVIEKQISLRMGHAEGLAISGGHDPRLVRAMVRTDYVLSVSFSGGRPVYHENYDGDLLLTDDGKDENKDEDPFFGNDVLTLTADIAYRLGLSRGTVERLDDLLFDLGVSRDYVLVEGRGDRVLREWSSVIENTERSIRRMWRDMDERPIQGDYDERTRARGYHINTLRQIKSLLERYREALNPLNISNPPMMVDDLITGINLRLEQLMAEARRDRR